MKALVLAVNGLHLGYLGCYGNEWVATPHLDRLAAKGIVFDQHYADCPAAQPRSSWSGLYQFPPLDDRTGEVRNLLGETLDRHGVTFLLLEPGRLPARKIDPLARSIQKALAKLETLAAKSDWLLWVDLPSFCPPWRIPEEFLNLYFVDEGPDEETDDEDHEPLAPWLDPPIGPVDTTDETAWDRLQFTYAGAISHLDDQIGVLLDGLQQLVPDDDLLVCFTAESGLALGEHSIVGPARPWLHDELVHLPLLLSLPGGMEAGRRVGALTQPVDLMPTLLAAFGLPIPSAHGCNLLPLVRGEVAQVRTYACSGFAIDDSLEWALHTSKWAFLLPLKTQANHAPRTSQLFRKPDDRWEVNNVIQHHQEQAEHLEQSLRAFIVASRVSGSFQLPELRDV